MNTEHKFSTRLVSAITCRSRSMDERLQDTLWICCNLGGWTISLSCPRNHSKWLTWIQGSRGVQTQRSQRTPEIPSWRQPSPTARLTTTLATRPMPRPTLLTSQTRLRNSWMVTQELHVTWRSKLLTRTWQNTAPGTRATLAVQDDHQKPELASYSWMLQHLPHSLNNGTIWDGTTRRTLTHYKTHSWLPTSLSKDLHLLRLHTIPDFSMYKTQTYNWFCSYPEAHEALPHNMPEPHGQLVKLWGYFDASHASCLKTQHSVTGILLFINSCPIH